MEECPDRNTKADKHAKFMARKDRALATIVLAVELPPWRSWGSSSSLEKAIWTIPEEDMGQQTKPQEEAIHHEIEW